MYFYCFFSFEYFESFDHFAALWFPLRVIFVQVSPRSDVGSHHSSHSQVGVVNPLDIK